MHRRVVVLLLLLLLPLAGCQGSPAAPVQLRSMGQHFRETKEAVISSPAVADLDGDGVMEIAIGSWDGYFYLLDARLNSLPGWPKHSPQGFFASPALTGLDGDGELEVLVSAEAGKLYAWNKDGSDVPGWPISLGYRAWSSPTVLPDGRIAIGGLRQTMVMEPDGQPSPGWPQPHPNWADATVAVGPDLLVVTTLTTGRHVGGALNAWHLDGRPYPWSPRIMANDSDSSPAIADLDDDGAYEIVYGDDAGYVYVIGLDGVDRPGWPQRTASLVEASPAIADLDGDGLLEVVCGSWDGRMYVWDHAGRLLPGWPQAARDQFISSAALVDLDGDGAPDIIAGSKDGQVYGWTARGEALPGFPIDLGHHVFSSPWVGDLEGDGRADMVVGANNGIHLLRDVGSMGEAPWPRFHRDLHNTGFVP